MIRPEPWRITPGILELGYGQVGGWPHSDGTQADAVHHTNPGTVHRPATMANREHIPPQHPDSYKPDRVQHHPGGSGWVGVHEVDIAPGFGIFLRPRHKRARRGKKPIP